MTHPSWVALHGMTHSFIESDETVVHVISLISDCGFHSVCPLMGKDKRFMEASWWERLTVGETGSCADGWGHLSKTLIQLSVDGRGCVPSLLFDLRPDYSDEGNEAMEVMKIMATSFKRSHACTAALSAPDPVATADPHLCQRLLDTPWQVWVSLLWGHCSFFLRPGAHKVLFVPSKSLFP